MTVETEVRGLPSSGAAILVVDDNASKRLAITAAIEGLGHAVIEVASGAEALRAVIDRPFAVVLMDVQMPGMDGYETARGIRRQPGCEHTPIIFITSHMRDEAQVPIAYASGAVDFIFAPIVPAILRAKVSIFVELFQKSRELARSLADVTTLGTRSRDSEAHVRSILDNVADGIVTVDEAGVIESFNRAATALFGYSEQEAIGQPISMMVGPRHPSDFGDFAAAKQQLLTPHERGARSAEALGRRKDGSTFAMELDLSLVQLGARTIHIGCLRDISERRSYTEQLRHRALHDDLTQLPNRVLFADRVNHALNASRRSGDSLALLVMDLDGFKEVNDRLGHRHGDDLLKLVAQRLSGCLREGDTVARLGGDEFGVLPLGTTDLAGAATVVWTIEHAMAAPFAVGGSLVDVHASIGLTLFPDHGDNIDDLLRRADLAMYEAKQTGSGYAMFAAEQERAPARRLALLDNLRRCIERDELVLHYQPKIDLATRRTIGVEALIRWNHPSGRLLMPGQFMPEVENSDLMIPITEWVIGAALGRLRAWRDDGYDLTMAVNLGARCLAQGSRIFEAAEELTRTWEVPPDKLTFELTESALIDTAAPDLLERLCAVDGRLSIDDFGTGYSSLVYLQRLPVAEIKADRSFVTSLMTVPADAVIVRSIIDLAHSLGVKVVAEGVEDEATMEILVEYGCDEAQGYFFSRPLPGGHMVDWFRSSPFGVTPDPSRDAGALEAGPPAPQESGGVAT